MPNGTTSTGHEATNRGRYTAQACTICRAKKTKCDGVKPTCGSCTAYGRGEECSWGRATPHWKPRTGAHFEALCKRADALQAYVQVLEGMLAKCVCQDVSAHIELRPHHLESNQLKDTLLTIDSDEEPIDPDDDITSELCLPTQLLKLGDRAGGLLRFGITTPFRFVAKPPKEMSRSPDIIQNPSASYVLLVDGIDAISCDLNFDWSRHLPPEVPLNRKEHDKILDLFFKFCSIFCLRVIPSFFLRDMYRALSLPASHCPPKTPNYSPMLHNAIMAIAAVYSDDPHINDWTSREYFATEAKRCLESECQKPDIGLIHALGLLGTYHADLGASILGDLYFGMSARVSQSLGLGLDASAWVKSGLITNEEMIARNYTHWTIFALDVCWALYVGREFPPLPEGRNTPMPLISPESDQLPWHYEPANIPPQPNFLSLIFSASTSLFLIARKIIHVLDDLGPRNSPQEDFIHHDQLVTQIDLELNSWKSQLSPEIDITLANRAKSTPQRLMLHCMYWWCFILLHRPFCNRRSRPIQTSDKEIDHVKLCKRSAENIIELLETWSNLYTLRNTPMTLPQITFAAGTVFILLSLQATLNGRIAHQALKTSLSQAGLCVQYLYRMGKSWRGATRIGDILRGLLDAKVRPVLERRKILAEQAMDAGAISAPVATDDPQGDAKLHSLPFHPADAGTPSVMSSTSQAPCGEMPVWSQATWDLFNDPSPYVLDGLLESSCFAPPMVDDTSGIDFDMAELLLPTSEWFLSERHMFIGAGEDRAWHFPPSDGLP